VNYVTLLMIHLVPMIDNTKSLKCYEVYIFLVEISDLGDKYLKMTYLCSNYEW